MITPFLIELHTWNHRLFGRKLRIPLCLMAAFVHDPHDTKTRASLDEKNQCLQKMKESLVLQWLEFRILIFTALATAALRLTDPAVLHQTPLQITFSLRHIFVASVFNLICFFFLEFMTIQDVSQLTASSAAAIK